jgi:uncharacterized Zn finger protein
MSTRIHLACDVCGQEFLVTIADYEAHSGVVECPRCGSYDLVLLSSPEGSSRQLDGAAA